MSDSGRSSVVSKDGIRLLLLQAAADTGVDVMMLTLEKPPRLQPLLGISFSGVPSHPQTDARPYLLRRLAR